MSDEMERRAREWWPEKGRYSDPDDVLTSLSRIIAFAEQVRLATQPYLYEALNTCANRDWDSTTSEAYRLIEAAMVLLGCHPTGRTLDQVAQSTHAKAVAAIRALAGEQEKR